MKLLYQNENLGSLSLHILEKLLSHVLKISFLLFKVLFTGSYKINFFSFKHTLHFPVMGLYGGALSTSSHLKLKSLQSSLRLQTWLLRVVLCLALLLDMSYLCPPSLFLNVAPVAPVYVSTLPDPVSVTVAL